MSTQFALNQLKLKKEETYFTWVAVLSAVAWLVIVISIIGLIYGLLIALFIWIGHGLVIAHLRSESVLVTPQQMPVLYRTYMDVVERLQMKETPPLYITQAHGLLNAFATRRSGRHFVVIYSDMLEACGEDTAQMRFLIGHELGHVRSNHIFKKMLLMPGMLCPLLGSAYSRACEGTCDRYGAFAAGDLREAARAMLILSGGKRAWHDMAPEAFAAQYHEERGFFISWHELTSGYPTLSQRTNNLLTMDVAKQPERAPRHPLAYFFALFTAGGRHGSPINMLITIWVIALLCGIAVPAFTAVQAKAKVALSLSHGKQLVLACKQYAIDNGGKFPPSLDDLFPTYLRDKSVLISPFAPSDPEGYSYHAGLKDTDPPDTILVWDSHAPDQQQQIVVNIDDSAKTWKIAPGSN